MLKGLIHLCSILSRQCLETLHGTPHCINITRIINPFLTHYVDYRLATQSKGTPNSAPQKPSERCWIKLENSTQRRTQDILWFDYSMSTKRTCWQNHRTTVSWTSFEGKKQRDRLTNIKSSPFTIHTNQGSDTPFLSPGRRC